MSIEQGKLELDFGCLPDRIKEKINLLAFLKIQDQSDVVTETARLRQALNQIKSSNDESQAMKLYIHSLDMKLEIVEFFLKLQADKRKS